ncbi:inverse autotransporter beta domain-containing protein [Xenorhabdus khoisanae]|uniref:inverse autotransporter beta domain-containing protein n=1 Tax=Xenorhabdus khoisanae TaxID=880157 RepID=UPI00069CC556|nr:inverse autotransporter beta-barrel domain-containing protein [Xenorhabdus khoisanae]
MSSYARKIIGFFIFFYALFMPSTVINALAEANVKADDKLYAHLQKTNDTSVLSAPHNIVSNAQTVSHILSSSPSELAEQATSYALGKINNTLSSETQKWLSQFGTARINFGLDRKWTLKNNSLDILLPLYDNKADWLFFSQLGYRNQDSRNTMNLGLGGRYFYQNWMYGLNTFYDHDFTGKNQRLGLGGEIWGDYIKFSANTYYRLSDWQKSRNFQDYYERPANGYDINGEFFLPAYPNLGMKLTYEQYFGDKVTLFNRDTKQKNPSLAKLGLTYTPIPLVTMGVDYKQGESGHTETQFLANLIYRFGVPFTTQFSPANVASMRTLAGSRYDLAERNNHIVLDHLKREQEILIALEPIVGYGHQEIPVNLPIPSNIDIKKIRWAVPDNAFLPNKGKLSSDSDQSIVITLPSYQETHKNDYLLDILLEYKTDGQEKAKPIQVPMKVLPFMIEGKVNITPPESPIATGKKENGYTFNAPIITYEDAPSGKFVKNARIDKVTWTTEPALGTVSGLTFLWNNKPAQTNEKGELTDEKEQLMPNVLVSEKPHDKVDIYIQLDGAPQQKIGSVTFSKKQPHYKIKDNKLSVTPDPKKALIADGIQKYTYTADIITDGDLAADKVDNVRWSAVGKNLAGKEIKDISVEAPTGTVKTDNGKLKATLSSKTPLKDVVVTLSIANKESVSAEAVSFAIEPENINVICKANGEQPVLVTETYTCTATVTDVVGQGVPDKSVNWQVKDNIDLKPTPSSEKTNRDGKVTATLTSPIEASNIVVIASVTSADGQSSQGESKEKINFIWPEITMETEPKDHDVTIGGQGKYSLTATAWREKNKTAYKGQGIKFRWSKPQNQDGTEATGATLSPSTDSSQSVNLKDGTLQANVVSSKAQQVKACIDIDGRKPAAPTCSDVMNFVDPPPEFDISWVKVTDFDENNPLQGNGTDEYHYKALIVKKGTTEYLPNYTFNGKWKRDHDKIEETKFPQPKAYSPADPTNEETELKTDGNGYLYATLKSSVGVENVTVTLNMTEPDGTDVKHDADTQVKFNPVPKPAVLYVYNKNNKAVFKYFDNTGGKDHPHTVLPSVLGELRESKNSGSFYDDKEIRDIQYKFIPPIDGNKAPYGDLTLSFGNNLNGPIQFNKAQTGAGEINTQVTMESGEIKLYKYEITMNKVTNGLPPYNYVNPNLDSNINCNSNSSGENQDLYSDKEAYDPNNPADVYSLYNEWGREFNLYDWGMFDSTPDRNPNKATVIVKNTGYDSNSKPFRVYDSKNNNFDKQEEGIIFCYQKS